MPDYWKTLKKALKNSQNVIGIFAENAASFKAETNSWIGNGCRKSHRVSQIRQIFVTLKSNFFRQKIIFDAKLIKGDAKLTRWRWTGWEMPNEIQK